MEYGSPALFIAIALSLLSGTLFAKGDSVGAVVTAVIAVVLLTLRRIAREDGDDGRHTLW